MYWWYKIYKFLALPGKQPWQTPRYHTSPIYTVSLFFPLLRTPLAEHFLHFLNSNMEYFCNTVLVHVTKAVGL